MRACMRVHVRMCARMCIQLSKNILCLLVTAWTRKDKEMKGLCMCGDARDNCDTDSTTTVLQFEWTDTTL